MTTIQLIEEHFKEHRKTLLKISTRKLGEFWAEDALQDAYDRALRYEHKYDRAYSLDAYIKKILENVIRSYQNDLVPTEEVEEHMWESGELADEMRAKGVLKEVLEDLCALPEPARTDVYLSLIQGEKNRDVSRITGSSEGSIKMSCMRFKSQMREKYGQD